MEYDKVRIWAWPSVTGTATNNGGVEKQLQLTNNDVLLVLAHGRFSSTLFQKIDILPFQPATDDAH
eukprot:scaffold4790_cov98-Cylindrotheca_fusiformis.AAC.5